jgi:hypothetical protein
MPGEGKYMVRMTSILNNILPCDIIEICSEYLESNSVYKYILHDQYGVYETYYGTMKKAIFKFMEDMTLDDVLADESDNKLIDHIINKGYSLCYFDNIDEICCDDSISCGYNMCNKCMNYANCGNCNDSHTCIQNEIFHIFLKIAEKNKFNLQSKNRRGWHMQIIRRRIK